jgi:hypothetical protein
MQRRLKCHKLGAGLIGQAVEALNGQQVAL